MVGGTPKIQRGEGVLLYSGIIHPQLGLIFNYGLNF
jgi:hypothetical protein